jgi:hypothetical protein
MSQVAPLNLLSAVVALDASLVGWTLLDGGTASDRAVQHHIEFERPFAGPPVVHVGLAGIDVSREDNVRLRVRALDITSSGFILEAATWWNTKIWSVDISWLAIGS